MEEYPPDAMASSQCLQMAAHYTRQREYEKELVWLRAYFAVRKAEKYCAQAVSNA